jgi:SLT domain-containing protein
VPSSLKGRGILDPVGNVAAAIRYIVARYGNITRVQQANASLPPKGYDSGGWLLPGASLTLNKTGTPEAVLTASQWSTMAALAAQGVAAAGASAPRVRSAPEEQARMVLPDKVRLVVGDREFEAYIDSRADDRVAAGFTRVRRAVKAGKQ